jgi:hypothetical protein
MPVSRGLDANAIEPAVKVATGSMGPRGAHFLVTSSKLYFPCEFGANPATAGVVA